MRNPMEVIDEIKEEIPKGESSFLIDLDKLKRDMFYKAPEDIGACFELISDELQYHIPEPPKHEWQFKVLSIFSTISIEEIKESMEKEYGKYRFGHVEEKNG